MTSFGYAILEHPTGLSQTSLHFSGETQPTSSRKEEFSCLDARKNHILIVFIDKPF